MQRNVARLSQNRPVRDFLVGHQEELFEYYYVTMGAARSQNKLVGYCTLKGWVNPRTRKPPVRMALWFSMWRWAIEKENQEKAYQFYNRSLMDDGKFMTRAQWKELIEERAIVCLRGRESTYQKWKADNGIA